MRDAHSGSGGRSNPGAVDLVVLLPSRVFGGAERTIVNLIEGIARLPASPRVTVCAHADMMAPHLSPFPGVELVDTSTWGLGSTLSGLRSVRRDAAMVAERLLSLRDGQRKTVVLCFLHYGAAMAVWLKRQFRGNDTIKVVASPRGPSVGGIPMITHLPSLRRLWHLHMALAGRWCDAVVVPSEGMKHELEGVYWAPRQRVHAIANSYPSVLDDVWQTRVARGLACAPGAPTRFVMATRLSSEKNIDLAVRAFAIHHQHHPADSMTIMGEGPAYAEIEALVASQGLTGHVVLEPFHAAPFQRMAEHDVYVHTCLIEGFGNSMLEALALGLPVIATDCDFGPRQLVMPGINGLLTPVCDASALAQAMADIKAMPSEALKNAARESSRAYSNFLMAVRYVDLFCRL